MVVGLYDSSGIQNSRFDDTPGGDSRADGGSDGHAFPPRDPWLGRLRPADDGVHQFGRHYAQREENTSLPVFSRRRASHHGAALWGESGGHGGSGEDGGRPRI